MNEIETRQLRLLVALAEEGTFTDAAIRLGMSQPAVSRALARFEARIGATLVERTTRSLRLTAAGEACYRAAVSALLAVADVHAAAHGRSRPLRLGYTFSAFGRHTTTILTTWRAERPDVPLEVHRIDSRDAGLGRGLVDVAIRRDNLTSKMMGDDDEEPALRVEDLFAEGRLAAVPNESVLATRVSLTLEDLTDQAIALTPSVGTTRPELWPPRIRPARFLVVANTDEWLITIASGQGVGVTPESTATQHAHPGVTFVPLTGVAPVAVRLVWLETRRHPAVGDFLGVVRRCVGSAPVRGGLVGSAPVEPAGEQGDEQADPGQPGGHQVR